jgi:hypothetical protein
MYYFFILAFIIVILLLLTFLITFLIKRNFKTNKDKFNELYNKLEGVNKKYAYDALNIIDQYEQNDPITYYRKGVILQHNLQQNNNAKKCYKQALTIAANAPANGNATGNANGINTGNNINANTILFITDHINYNAQLLRDRELIDLARGIQNSLSENKKIEKKYTSDSQNVHDSAISNDIIEQYNIIKEYNNREQLNHSIENFEPKKNDKHDRIKKVIDIIKSNSATINIINDTEYNLLNAVWNRIHSIDNKENYNKLIDALENQLYECSTSDMSIVCVAGRCAHIISVLALLDKDERLGILKNKEMLRNEFLDKVSKIVEYELS